MHALERAASIRGHDPIPGAAGQAAADPRHAYGGVYLSGIPADLLQAFLYSLVSDGRLPFASLVTWCWPIMLATQVSGSTWTNWTWPSSKSSLD